MSLQAHFCKANRFKLMCVSGSLAKTGFKTGYSHVCAPKILEVPKEHAQRKSQATLRSSRGVNKPTT